MTNKKLAKQTTRTLNPVTVTRAAIGPGHRQPTGLTREELRQIVIEMIG